jgi:hypothetical protein
VALDAGAEQSAGPVMEPVLDESKLLDEGLRKTALIWVGPVAGDAPERAVWHVWDSGLVYVLCGPGEQPPPVAPGTPARVVVPSKDKHSRLLSVDASTDALAPGEEWDRIAAIMATKRLNLPDGDAAPARWARDCTILRLRPAARLVEAPGRYDSESHARSPVPTTAGTVVPRPWHLFGRPGKSKRRG